MIASGKSVTSSISQYHNHMFLLKLSPRDDPAVPGTAQRVTHQPVCISEVVTAAEVHGVHSDTYLARPVVLNTPGHEAAIIRVVVKLGITACHGLFVRLVQHILLAGFWRHEAAEMGYRIAEDHFLDARLFLRGIDRVNGPRRPQESRTARRRPVICQWVLMSRPIGRRCLTRNRTPAISPPGGRIGERRLPRLSCALVLRPEGGGFSLPGVSYPWTSDRPKRDLPRIGTPGARNMAPS